MDDGTVQELPDCYELRFERLFNHPAQKIWAALTDPGRLAEWLAHGEIGLRANGRAHLAFTNSDIIIDGPVTAVEPQRLLEFRWMTRDWDAGPLRWELFPEKGDTRFVLTHLLPTPEHRLSLLAGWHTHLDLLSAALDGKPLPWRNERWQELHEHYAKLVH